MKRLVSLLFFLSLSLAASAKSSIIWQIKSIPMQTTKGQIFLEALLVTPGDQQQHPVVLINHGSPRDAKERSLMSALAYLPIAKQFALRGYAVAVVLRRGYGRSGGGWVEAYDRCSHPDYLRAAHAAAEDLRAVIQYLGQLPAFDCTNIVAVGYSAGGFATLALTAFKPPKGLKAAVVFAPGRGSYAPEKICEPQRLIAAFAQLGKTSRIPMLWIYAKNDHFFNPKLAKSLFAAFTANGGKAQFLSAKAFAKEGHFLFSTAGISRWTVIVDNYLASIK
ncbi:S9 family peptidase [Legionella sp. km772]|uniref:alpha/beta hydrolase family protein n=1 Tax=Legionella sp. km772 TaxID=2498111 RepID=UPI000F8C8F75|nr:alpha/beta fold hydrolase [Legionella sp. km772]RUR05081.1 alpha/beta fold hydrolase [Legionella sp. km772]